MDLLLDKCSFWKDATAEAEKLVEVDGIELAVPDYSWKKHT